MFSKLSGESNKHGPFNPNGSNSSTGPHQNSSSTSSIFTSIFSSASSSSANSSNSNSKQKSKAGTLRPPRSLPPQRYDSSSRGPGHRPVLQNRSVSQGQVAFDRIESPMHANTGNDNGFQVDREREILSELRANLASSGHRQTGSLGNESMSDRNLLSGSSSFPSLRLLSSSVPPHLQPPPPQSNLTFASNEPQPQPQLHYQSKSHSQSQSQLRPKPNQANAPSTSQRVASFSNVVPSSVPSGSSSAASWDQLLGYVEQCKQPVNTLFGAPSFEAPIISRHQQTQPSGSKTIPRSTPMLASSSVQLPSVPPPRATTSASASPARSPEIPPFRTPPMSPEFDPSFVSSPSTTVGSTVQPRGPNISKFSSVMAETPTRSAGQGSSWDALLARASSSPILSSTSLTNETSGQPLPPSSSSSASPSPHAPSTAVMATAPSPPPTSSSTSTWDALLARANAASSPSNQAAVSNGGSGGSSASRVASLFKSRGSSSNSAAVTSQTSLPPVHRGSPPSIAPPSELPPPLSISDLPPLSNHISSTAPIKTASPPPIPITLSNVPLPPDGSISRTIASTASLTLPSPTGLTGIGLKQKETERKTNSIGITGFVKAPEGPKNLRKGMAVSMATSPCVCCAATLQYPRPLDSFRCTVCGTITDVGLSERRAAGLARDSDPEPLTLARFQYLIRQARSSAGLLSPTASSFRMPFVETDVAEAKTLEGDSENEQDEVRGIEVRSERSEQKESRWQGLEEELHLVFSHWSSLSNSFSTSEPSAFNPGIDLSKLRAFYAILNTLPSELHESIFEALQGLFRRPRRRFHEKQGPKGLTWVIILLENDSLFKSRDLKAGTIIKRFLGIVSNLSNDQHHILVNWFNQLYDKDEFQHKLELISTVVVPRIVKHIPASALPPASRSKTLPYLYDWRFRSTARVLSLMFASNMAVPRVPISAFYITLIDQLNAVVDYDAWVRTASTSSKQCFFVSQYPFLMSLGSKLKILLHDSKVQQSASYNTSYIDLDGRRLIQPYITIRVRRERLMEDSLAQISVSIHYLKRALRIEFAGEEGVDAGGLKKEWFLLLVRELFDPRYGMWVWDEETNLCWFNPASLESEEQYTLVGVVIGLAVYHASTLDIRLPVAAFKRLLDEPVTLTDLEEWQPSLVKGLRVLLEFEGDVEEVFCRTFVGEYEAFGEIIPVPLIPNGENTPVTSENREEYVERLVEFMLVTSVSRQFRAFQKGWLSVCEGNALSLFHAEEISLLVCGSPDSLDVAQLRGVTVYEGCSAEDELIESFWELVSAWSTEQQQKLLAFVTGSDRVPATGLINMSFRIQATRVPETYLPSSHTCFNTLCLPRYRSKTVLQKKLEEALTMSQGFGLK
ncbi:E3 ubiquitin protein ligase [Phaffia rhodozyma]|uniref:HECT-type E3 ubiquitin transferase n=1 Tax=Phaffia rhodozyma TaxID=264483 RepID=A0A0F7SJL3_PHARH|nr:E3 ubiquitin protein ligase [Phaffia rhodozyma]